MSDDNSPVVVPQRDAAAGGRRLRGRRSDADDLVTVTVRAPFRVFHSGRSRAPGEEITVSRDVAVMYERHGWVIPGAGVDDNA